MSLSPSSEQNFYKTACYFEGSLLVFALILGWLLSIDPLQHLVFSEFAIAYGVLATLPLSIFFFALQAWQLEELQRIRRLLLETLGPHLSHYHWTDLLVLAIVAGISEEVLFRAVLQPWLESAFGMDWGLLASSVLFGFAHAITPLYALLATLMGLYLGYFLDYGGARNLLIPIVIHTLYDFFAFLMLVRQYRRASF